MAGDGVEVAKLEEKELKLCEDQVSHLALDIGGSLIKMVYFSSSSSCSTDDQENGFIREGTNTSSGNLEYRVLSGRLHFLKFETSKISECIEFISSKRLQHYGDQGDEAPAGDKHIVKATGGGAFKFSDLFKEKLGIILDKVDEMSSLVAGANFLLKCTMKPLPIWMV